MTDKFYWMVAIVGTAGIVYVGMTYHAVLTGFHILVCLLLVLVVLLQSGRAADLAGAFGGAGSQTAFGPRGAATFFSKATTFLAIVFMITSFMLALFASRAPAGSALTPADKPPASQSAPAELPGPDRSAPPAEEAPSGPPSSQP